MQIIILPSALSRPEIGEIDISPKKVKKGFKYIINDAEYLAVLAIPDVLTNGVHISTDLDHDNRGYPTYTFAAPITINGKSGNMAIVVKATGTNKYKMHRVITPDGKILSFSDDVSAHEKTNESMGYPSKMTAESSGESLPITHASDNSIPQPHPVVKIENDGSIMLPTAEGEINAAAANKKDILPGFSDVTTETTEMTGRACGVSEENIGIAVRLSHALGVKVAFYEDLTSDERGQYLPNTGVIWVNSKYQDVFSNVFGHELTHKIESSKFYKALDRFVVGKLKAEGKDINVLIKQKQESYARRGISLSDDAARREVIAKYVGEVLLNNEAVIADIANTDRGLGGFLLSKIDGLVAKITGKNKEAVYIRKVQQMFRKALEDVSRKEGVKVSDGSKQQRSSVYEDAGLNELAERYRRGDLSQAEYLEAYNEYLEQNPGLEDEDFFEGRSFDLDEGKLFDKRLLNEFKGQVQNVKHEKASPNNHLIIGRTPEILLKIGFKSLPMTIDFTHTEYAVKNTKNSEHYIEQAVLSNIANEIANPIAVIENPQSPGRILAILDIKSSGKNIVCSFDVVGTARNGKVDYNSSYLVTVYGDERAAKWLEESLIETMNHKTKVFYINNKKATHLLKSAKRNLPGALVQLDGFVHSIHDTGSNINIPITDITESLQFKRWFGNISRSKRNSSKIVDKNGNPLTMYRGDENPIYIYEKDTNPQKGLPDLGKGIYFTSNKDVAKEQGKYFSEVFLNVRKPFNVFEESGDFYESIANYARISLESINRDNANDILKKRGFDGVVQYDSDNNIKNVVVFDPHQAKNANGGLGLYDSDNPDRRYDFDDANDFADDEMLYDSSFAAKYDPSNSERSKAIRKEREQRTAERKADEFSSRGLEGKDWWSKNRNKADRMFNKRELERLSRIKSELEDADELTVEQMTALWGEMRKLQRNVMAMSMAHQITNEELTQVTDLLRGDRTIEDIEKLPADRYNIDGIIAVAKRLLN